MSTSTPTPKINTSSLPTSSANGSLPNKQLPSSTQTLLTSALLSASSIPRIESALSQDLAACGWTDALRTYITQLLRSGECSTYQECLVKVMATVRAANAESSGIKAGVGATGEAERDLAIPQAVLREGVRNVRREVERVCELRVDDVDD